MLPQRKASPRGVDPLPAGGAAAGARESVVGRLLASQRSDLRTAGARLVAAFAATQVWQPSPPFVALVFWAAALAASGFLGFPELVGLP